MGQKLTSGRHKTKRRKSNQEFSPRSPFNILKRKLTGNLLLGDEMVTVFDSLVLNPNISPLNYTRSSKDYGSAISSDSSRSSSPCPTRYKYGEFERLKMDWNKMENKDKVFICIFEDIILSAPSDMFIKLPKVEHNGQDITIQTHASNVQRFFEKIMNQGSLGTLFDMAVELGTKHSTFGISFNAGYWLNIKNNMIKHIAPDETLPIHISWSKLIHDIIKGARIGFNQAILETLSEKSLDLSETESDSGE